MKKFTAIFCVFYYGPCIVALWFLGWALLENHRRRVENRAEMHELMLDAGRHVYAPPSPLDK